MADFLPPVVASLRGDISDYLAKLAAADEAMKKFGKSIPEGLGKQKEPIGREGKKAGDEYGGKFSESVTKKITEAYKALPDLKLTADSSETDRKLVEVKAEMEALSKQRINIDIDEATALAKIELLKHELGTLYDAAGSKGRRLDIGSTLSSLDPLAKTLASDMGKIGEDASKSLLKKLTGGVKQAANVGSSIAKEIGAGFSQATEGVGLLSPEVLLVLAPAAVLAASMVGAMIGGAILTGIGLAGIGAGIALELHDPAIKAETSQLGRELSSGLHDAASSFEAPLARGIASFRTQLNSLMPGIKATFASLAPEIEPLSAGLGGFFTNLVPQIEQAAIKSKPLLDFLARELPNIGTEIGSVFTTIGDHAQEAETGLRLLTGGFAFLVQTINIATVSGAKVMDMFMWFHDHIYSLIPGVDNTTKQFRNLNQAVGDTGTAATAAAPDLQALQAQLNATTLTADQLAGAMVDKVVNAFLKLDHANLSWQESLTNLTETFHRNSSAMNIRTKAGQADREAVLAVVSANIALYDSNIASGMAAGQAAVKYDQGTASLEKQLHRLGWNQKAIDDLIGKYKGIPTKIDTEIATKGLTDAINNLGQLLSQIYHLDGKTFGFNIAMSVKAPDWLNYRAGERGATGGLWSGAGKIRHYAQGGLATEPTIGFGEPQTGGEWLIPNRGISPARATWLLGNAAAAHGLAVGVPAGRGGDGASAPSYVPIVVNLGGQQMAAVHAQLIPAAQQYKIRTGTTGLS